ncbi:hypothetical protein CDEST_01817 [Colletotrichum destructivum]|uniref:Uncharacterized protein n=1 Tax=Colletotrichum destructivum TaxID=34406 RepID=A0AAX4I075_9PEZI|nr:hypothetical protein CDEST_01817 [Colletotrichum destructivum]
MCRTPRYLHICPCVNPACPRRNQNPITERAIRPGEGHVIECEVEPQTWDYCDRWFYEQPYEVVLNAFTDPKDFCPYFRWNDMKQTEPLCDECLVETARLKAEKLATLRARWKDPRVAVPYEFMPPHLRDAEPQGSQARRRNANHANSASSSSSTSNSSASNKTLVGSWRQRSTLNPMAPAFQYPYMTAPIYHHPPPRFINRPTGHETRQSLEEQIKYLDQQIGSLETLQERPNPPPKNGFRTFGVVNNPYDHVGKSGKPAITVDTSIPRTTPYGAIGSERAAARSGNATGNSSNLSNVLTSSEAPNTNPFGSSRNFLQKTVPGTVFPRPPHPPGAIGQEVHSVSWLSRHSEADNSSAPASNPFGVIGQPRRQQ